MPIIIILIEKGEKRMFLLVFEEVCFIFVKIV